MAAVPNAKIRFIERTRVEDRADNVWQTTFVGKTGSTPGAPNQPDAIDYQHWRIGAADGILRHPSRRFT
jgi:hypothetical protein